MDLQLRMKGMLLSKVSSKQPWGTEAASGCPGSRGVPQPREQQETSLRDDCREGVQGAPQS